MGISCSKCFKVKKTIPSYVEDKIDPPMKKLNSSIKEQILYQINSSKKRPDTQHENILKNNQEEEKDYEYVKFTNLE
jgi:hypothetical protein